MGRRERAAQADLQLLGGVLWGDERALRSGGPGHDPFAGYVFIGSDGGLLLVPRGARKMMAAAVERGSLDKPWRRRLLQSGASVAFRLGFGARLLPGVTVEPALDRSTVFDYVSALFPDRRLSFAIGLGQRRANRKPIVQVLTDDGRTLAWAKVAWNALTQRLVSDERTTLEALDGTVTPRVRVPRVVSFDTIGPVAVLVLEPLPTWTWRQHLRKAPPPWLFPELAHATTKIADGADAGEYATERQRVLMEALPPADRDAVSATVDRLVGDFGAQSPAFGLSHGDLAPWNMAWNGEQLALWDWERCAVRPVGFDAVHYAYQRVRYSSSDFASSFRTAAATPALADLGLRAADRELVVRLYLVELIGRLGESNTSGVPALTREQRALLSMLVRPGPLAIT